MGGKGLLFLAAVPPPETRPVPKAAAILGVSLDRTASYRSGAAGGPEAVRRASWSLETFSPAQGRDLEAQIVYDFGDIALERLSLERSLSRIEEAVAELCRAGLVPVLIGGEHLVTLPAYRAVQRSEGGDGRPPVVFHYDAHADLRDTYEGRRLSHATVMRRVTDLAGGENLRQFGLRSGCREEMLWSAANVKGAGPGFIAEATAEALAEATGRSIYVTLDIDVLDPAHAPGTGNPEPGGPSALEVLEAVMMIGRAAARGAAGGGVDLAAFDLVEVAPSLDPTGRTEILAAKIIRELLIARGAFSAPRD